MEFRLLKPISRSIIKFPIEIKEIEIMKIKVSPNKSTKIPATNGKKQSRYSFLSR